MDMDMYMDVETIHESLVNGQRKQMARQINEYGHWNFWEDYKQWLSDNGYGKEDAYAYFSDAVINYNRIDNGY